MRLAIYRPGPTPSGSIVDLDVAVATTPAARTRGFSGRPSIGPDEAIFFAFPVDTDVPFTMRHTLVPLDIVFVCRDGHVIRVTTAPARMPDPIVAPRPYRYVLEVPGGWLARHGVGSDATLGWSPVALGPVV